MKKALPWIALALAALILWMFRGALGVLCALMLLSATTAYVVSPLARFCEKHISVKWGTLMAFGAVAALIAGWLFTFVPSMIGQAVAVGEALPGLWNRLSLTLAQWQDRLAKMGIPGEIIDSAAEQLGQIGPALMKKLSESVVGAAQWLISLGWVALTPVIAYYLLRDRAKLFSQAERLIPSGLGPTVLAMAAASREAIGRYARGQVLVSLITGVLTAVGLLIAGLPSWLIMGFFMMIFNLIPYFGPVLGAIPILFLATAQGWGMIFKCVLVVIASQQIESMLVTPRVLSGKAELHPVAVVAALFIGGSAGGLAGMVFVIPCVLVLRVIFLRLIDMRVRKNTAR